MRPHPWIVTLALLLAGVIAFGATKISRHREARRVRRLPLPADLQPAPPPRTWFPAPSAAAPPRPTPSTPISAPPTGVLRLSVTGPHGLRLAGVQAKAVRQDDPEEVENDFEQAQGPLELAGLTLGRYDIDVQAPGMRPAHVQGVPTNGETVAVALERAPVLRGVARLGAGDQGCAHVVYIRSAGNRLGTAVDQESCTFALEDVPQEGTFELFATGRGVAAHTLVTIPLAGDPAFVCLGDPCDERASLSVYVADARGVQVEEASLEWTLVGDEPLGELGNTRASGMTYLHDRRPGETLHLRARVDDRSGEATVVVRPGVTDVVLTVPVPDREGGADQ
jgi:hypothetical protein